MDDLRTTSLRRDLPAPQLQAGPCALPGRSLFLPLKLVMQPNGMTVELTRPDMVLGRHSTADLRLPLPDVSRRHCRFVFEEGAWQIMDLESLNGVYVNGLRVQEATVHDQDLIGIGGFQFIAMVGSTPRTAGTEGEEERQTADIIQNIARALPGPHGIQPTRKAS
jgi:pSer/pThr/pTyr-binding forkhead associated (FHA) protein